jgi:hypothetical protein
MYISARSLPRNEVEVSGYLHAPAALPTRKDASVPIGYETGCVPEPVLTRLPLAGVELSLLKL